jgi:hypothetical protein
LCLVAKEEFEERREDISGEEAVLRLLQRGLDGVKEKMGRIYGALEASIFFALSEGFSLIK